ncbi:MAG TPA: TatD family hydrolase [Polyangiaceae bacterium]|nr:TatD family hydrolase [Polyangiaceae bacterium]
MIDIGVNLTHKQFHTDISQVIERALAAHVNHLIITGLNVPVSRAALTLARSRPSALCCTAGIHPHNASSFGAASSGELRELGAAREVVAIGECGLDYERDFSPRPAQRAAFEAQLALAADLQRPVFLHQRGAHADFLRILSEYSPRLIGGVVHCFTGDVPELESYLALGLCIGITGFICDERRVTHLQALVRRIPSDRLMIETDAPFLLPRDLKHANGRRNEPAYLPHIAAAVARYSGRTEQEVRRTTTEVAFRLFGLARVFSA